jgi:methyltransferase (TIGR00027 family)
MNPVATTGLLVAAIRAEESRRPDRLFDDPFADTLAGEDGRLALAHFRSAGGMTAFLEVRTRWFDEALARAWAAGIRQFVLVAAGMDARAYRLPWPTGTRVFEIDQPEVIVAKARALGGATPRCRRMALEADLAGPWHEALLESGFDRNARTAWLVEGLLQYLEAASVEALLAHLDACSASGSRALCDLVGRRLLDAPFFAPVLQMMRELGAPWRFGTDEPEALLPNWNSAVVDPAEVGNAWQRWPFPIAPAGSGAIAAGYFVEATKP